MRQKALSSTRLIRSFNATSIMQTLFKQGTCSRADLAQITKMSPPTVSRIVAELINQGIVIEEYRGPSTGGRRPVMLRLDYAKLYVIGVQLTRDNILLALADVKGSLVQRRCYRPYALDPVFLIRELAAEIEHLISASSVTREHLLGIGVAVPGVVNKTGSSVRARSVSLGWYDAEIADPLESMLELPVFVENDANVGALAELWFGQARSVANSLYLKTETGVGAGIILDQQLYGGPLGMAGEIGHVPFITGGLQCRCGQIGCLEPYVYVPDVLARYNELTGRSIDATSFFRCAINGDPHAALLVDQALHALTLALSFSTALLDLDMVVISGVWGAFDRNFFTNIQTHIQINLRSTGLTKHVEVLGTSIGADADLLGAVGLVIDHWFSPTIDYIPAVCSI